jgi:hypothetical protein
MSDVSQQDASQHRRSPARLQWLHRVGYVTTTLVAIQILFIIGAICWDEWDEARRTRSWWEWSKTQEGPLKRDTRLPNDDLLDYLRQLLPIASLHGDGFHFVVTPSFSQSDYAFTLSLRQGAKSAKGSLYVLGSRTPEAVVQPRAFTVPAWDYRRYADVMDRLTDGWPGADEGCTDGAPVAFERIRGERVTSGRGNCSPHYGRIKRLNLALIRRFAPGPDLPTERDWYRPFPEDH